MQKPEEIAESHIRSFTKAFSWRVLATLTTMIISYFVTGSIAVALSIGSIEVVAKIFLYYFHERLWAWVQAGRYTKRSRQFDQIKEL